MTTSLTKARAAVAALGFTLKPHRDGSLELLDLFWDSCTWPLDSDDAMEWAMRLRAIEQKQAQLERD